MSETTSAPLTAAERSEEDTQSVLEVFNQTLDDARVSIIAPDTDRQEFVNWWNWYHTLTDEQFATVFKVVDFPNGLVSASLNIERGGSATFFVDENSDYDTCKRFVEATGTTPSEYTMTAHVYLQSMLFTLSNHQLIYPAGEIVTL